MAITLDELLGRNRGGANEPASVDSFPSYDAYTARRTENGSPAGYDRPAYNYDFRTRPYEAPRSVESARAYEASRPYEAPRVDEYRPVDYSTAFDRRAASPRESYAPETGYAPYPEDVRPARREDAARGGLYEFTVNDAERASSEDLYNRLSGVSPSAQSAQRERAARESYAENYAEKYRAANKARKRPRLGIKAKLLIAAYVAVVVIVSVLIIVNAKPLNDGTAAVPSSSVTALAEDGANNQSLSQIEFGYEVPEI